MLFFPVINVKLPTIVGILTFMSRKKISCSVELSMKEGLLPRARLRSAKTDLRLCSFGFVYCYRIFSVIIHGIFSSETIPAI